MATLAEALIAIDGQRDNLAANLTSKGVNAAATETLSALVAKVLQITIGGSDFAEFTATVPSFDTFSDDLNESTYTPI